MKAETLWDTSVDLVVVRTGEMCAMPSVQQVSEDGTPKSEVVGAVDAELVRAAS